MPPLSLTTVAYQGFLYALWPLFCTASTLLQYTWGLILPSIQGPRMSKPRRLPPSLSQTTPTPDLTQRVHVGIWYILRAQRGSHIPTLRPKYIPYSYMDPLGYIPSASDTAQSAKQTLHFTPTSEVTTASSTIRSLTWVARGDSPDYRGESDATCSKDPTPCQSPLPLIHGP